MGPSWAPSGSDDTDEKTGPSLDDRPGIGGVSETRRREAIVSLVNERPRNPYTIGELTVALSDWLQNETTGMVPTDEEIHSILYDFDLPRLDTANRLVFDPETGRVFPSDADDTTRPTAPTERTSERSTSLSGVVTDGEATKRTTGNGVPAERVVELGVLLLGVGGVALAASNASPLPPSFALVPAAVVVLFFGYRAVTRW